MQDELLSKLERTLSDEECSSCEGLLTLEECGLVLRGMASGKTPGSDGFPVKFYTTFWDILGSDIVRLEFPLSYT